MGLFGIVYFPAATSHFSDIHLLLRPSPLPPNHRLLSLTTKPQRSGLHHFLVNDNTPIQGQARALALAQAQTQPPIQSESAQEDMEEEDGVSKTRLLVQNVPWTCTVEDLRPLLENYGTVVEIEFSMYNKTRNRGLAFVTMGSHEEAVAALKGLESSEFEGRILKLNWAKPKKRKPSSSSLPQHKPLPVHNLFVANLPFQARANDLKEFFNADNGNVVSAEVIFHDNRRRSAGYGFVSFNTKADAEAALATFQGKEFMGRPLLVARSKRFLRQETKATIQSEGAQVT